MSAKTLQSIDTHRSTGSQSVCKNLTWAVQDEDILDDVVSGCVEVLCHRRTGQNAVRNPQAKIQLPQERVDIPADRPDDVQPTTGHGEGEGGGGGQRIARRRIAVSRSCALAK